MFVNIVSLRFRLQKECLPVFRNRVTMNYFLTSTQKYMIKSYLRVEYVPGSVSVKNRRRFVVVESHYVSLRVSSVVGLTLDSLT